MLVSAFDPTLLVVIFDIFFAWEARKMMTFFVDTNILLHYVPLDQVDWNEVCGTNSVTILIAPIVIEELDKQKRNSNAKISKRAKTVVKRIGEIGLKRNLSPFVSFEVITKRPSIDLYEKIFAG